MYVLLFVGGSSSVGGREHHINGFMPIQKKFAQCINQILLRHGDLCCHFRFQPLACRWPVSRWAPAAPQGWGPSCPVAPSRLAGPAAVVRWAPCPDACASHSLPRSRRRAPVAAQRALRWGAAGWASASKHVSVRSSVHVGHTKSPVFGPIMSTQCLSNQVRCRLDQAYSVG